MASRAPSTGALLLLLLLIVAMIGSCLLVFQAAHVVDKWLGDTGRSVLTRLLGVLLSALSVQFVADGCEGHHGLRRTKKVLTPSYRLGPRKRTSTKDGETVASEAPRAATRGWSACADQTSGLGGAFTRPNAFPQAAGFEAGRDAAFSASFCTGVNPPDRATVMLPSPMLFMASAEAQRHFSIMDCRSTSFTRACP